MYNFFGKKDNEEVYEEETTINQKVLLSGIKILKIKSFNEVERIATMIKERNVVAFNLENVRSDEGQRIIDYIYGATFVLDGRIEKITDRVYASIPYGISVENTDTQD